MVDFTHVKAHRSAAGGKGGSRTRLLAIREESATRRSTHSQMLKSRLMLTGGEARPVVERHIRRVKPPKQMLGD
jgi:hypothetical protein